MTIGVDVGVTEGVLVCVKVGEFVGVTVSVDDGVTVGDLVCVKVGDFVGVTVDVDVGVTVGVDVGVYSFSGDVRMSE